MDDPLILVRAVHFAATLLAGGAAGFLVLVAEPAARAIGKPAEPAFAALRRRCRLMIWSSLAVAILSGAAWLALVAADILGTPPTDVFQDSGTWTVLTDTRFGQVLCVRLALALLLGLLTAWPRMEPLQLTMAALLVALPAWTGHAGATPGTAGIVHLISDGVHLLAAGGWLGALPALALLLAQARGAAAVPGYAGRAVARFSVLGVVCVAALLASGIVNSWNLLGGPYDLIDTDYGRLVLAKIVLFLIMVAIATVNRFRLAPWLMDPTAVRWLQRTCLIETALGLCVLLAVGAVGTLAPTAHVHPAPTGIPRDAAFVHIHGIEGMADVTIEPGRAGRADVFIHIAHEDFSEFDAKSVRLTLDPPKGGGTAVARDAVFTPDGVWRVDGIDLNGPGIWTATVIVAPQHGEPITLDAPVVIDQ